MAEKQVFQTDTPSRWNRFKWLSRGLLIFLLLGIAAIVITIRSTRYPTLPDFNQAPKRLTIKELDRIKKSRKYGDFRVDTQELTRLRHRMHLHQLRHPNNKMRINFGFYRAWEPQAYTSLSDHINKMDIIVTEGFSITPGQDTVTVRLDTVLTNISRRYKKEVLMSLSNYINIDNNSGYMDTKTIERIVKDKKARTRFINDIVAKLTKYKFRGLNMELVDVQRTTKDYHEFEKELYQALHALNLMVTQNVMPSDDSYDLKHLQKYNDLLFVFATDQHTYNTLPGDIAHQSWVEELLDRVCAIVPSNKVVLVLTAGGYDWPENSEGTSVGYQQAISVAQENKSKVTFDKQSANLHYKYTALDSSKHTVYFMDAAANFNIMRMADDWGVGGIALWRLGYEDPRLWSFFSKSLAIDSLKRTGMDEGSLKRVGLNNHIDYTGDGEVLDLITQPDTGLISISIDKKTFMITDQQYKKLPTKYVIRKYGYKAKKVVLTFDDGPDPAYTPRILDILAKENVPAAFFIVGSMADKAIPIVKREFDAGYEIGNHTYFHPDISTIGITRVKLELNATRKLIESITGRSTILFRPPFNADAEPRTLAEVIPVAESRKQNYINIGESIDPHDWQPGVTADSIVARTIRMANDGSMILLHDAGGDTREETVKALPRIIHYFKAHGYQFTTIGDILDKTRDDLMPVIKEDAETTITDRIYDVFIDVYFYSGFVLNYIFYLAIFLAVGRIFLIGVLATRQYFINKREEQDMPDAAILPPVSIIVPGYNEEVTVVNTILSLLQINYPLFEVIFVDDGSKDNTCSIVTNAYADHPLVKVLTKSNGGKASALNYGIEHARYGHVICIDADTQLKTDAVYHLMRYFTDAEIGAVAGTVKVGNTHNLLTNWQAIEYITAQNMDRRAFDLLNSITVVPGAIGAFKKSAIYEAGGFTTDTLAEDCDLTMRILKLGYIVRNCDDAIAYTEAPETLSGLLKQRFRWSFGVIQSFWKNRNALFNKKYKFFGMVGMPNILLFQIILPLLSPLADVMMLVGFLGDNPFKIMWFYFAFIIIDLIVSALAFWMEKERSYHRLLYIIPQRFIWRQLMYWVLFKSIRRALKGELSAWGALTRTGNVKVSKDARG